MTRFHFSYESPIDRSTLRSTNYVPSLSLSLSIFVTVESPALHLHELHDHKTRQMKTSNYNYQPSAKSHKQLQELIIGDQVLIRVHPERFPLKTLKSSILDVEAVQVLRKFGSSTYELNISRDLGINPAFSVEDLTHYRTSTEPR